MTENLTKQMVHYCRIGSIMTGRSI